MYINEYIGKYFKFLKSIDEPTLMALAKREFYDQENQLDEDLNTFNAIFFRDIAPQNRMARNAHILKTKQEVEDYSKQITGLNNSFITVEKHQILFF